MLLFLLQDILLNEKPKVEHNREQYLLQQLQDIKNTELKTNGLMAHFGTGSILQISESSTFNKPVIIPEITVSCGVSYKINLFDFVIPFTKPNYSVKDQSKLEKSIINKMTELDRTLRACLSINAFGICSSTIAFGKGIDLFFIKPYSNSDREFYIGFGAGKIEDVILDERTYFRFLFGIRNRDNYYLGMTSDNMLLTQNTQSQKQFVDVLIQETKVEKLLNTVDALVIPVSNTISKITDVFGSLDTVGPSDIDKQIDQLSQTIYDAISELSTSAKDISPDTGEIVFSPETIDSVDPIATEAESFKAELKAEAERKKYIETEKYKLDMLEYIPEQLKSSADWIISGLTGTQRLVDSTVSLIVDTKDIISKNDLKLLLELLGNVKKSGITAAFNETIGKNKDQIKAITKKILQASIPGKQIILDNLCKIKDIKDSLLDLYKYNKQASNLKNAVVNYINQVPTISGVIKNKADSLVYKNKIRLCIYIEFFIF